VKCPYQTDTCIDRSDESNRFHYKDLANKIGGVMQKWTVKVLTLAVGKPGTWPRISTDRLRTIGFHSDNPTHWTPLCFVKYSLDKCTVAIPPWWNYAQHLPLNVHRAGGVLVCSWKQCRDLTPGWYTSWTKEWHRIWWWLGSSGRTIRPRLTDYGLL